MKTAAPWWLLMLPGCDAATDWYKSYMLRSNCSAAIERQAKIVNPQADVHVERCEIGTVVGRAGNPDICFISMLKDGQRLTNGTTLNCAEIVKEANHE